MRRYFNILSLVFVVALSFSACGVKKGMMAENQGPDVQTLEQRVAAGEFAWLDTMPNRQALNIAGPYKLFYQKGIEKNHMSYYDVFADSLVFTDSGYYKKYNSNLLVDYGRYSTQNVDTIMICTSLTNDSTMRLFKDSAPYHFIITFYSWDKSISQYMLPQVSMCLSLAFWYKIFPCEYTGKSDSYNTVWNTANRAILDNLKRNQEHIDSIAKMIPVFNGEY